MKLSLIAAVDRNMGIGKGNQLLCHLPNDLKRFKQMTMGKPIVMGRKTFQSIGKPLPGRRNIVISRTESALNGVDVYVSIDEALSSCETDEEVMIIGGATLYQQLIAQADRLYLTHIHASFDADTFFPAIDPNQWQVVSCQYIPNDEQNPYPFELKTYQKK
ncbi:dihydrofolate reductase [Legionella sp. W05-934-2]|jgi:dihydrofolate reductase|uniref:dihydrofolate reductase n=1 Tax=Legionella sp. W05-934-2 TaxID=1198649 RepID=UPI003462DB74